MPADSTDSYIYFTSWNTAQNEVTYASSGKPGLRQHVSLNDIPGLTEAINSKNRIYNNGGAQVLGP